jgi:hypothetical protein
MVTEPRIRSPIRRHADERTIALNHVPMAVSSYLAAGSTSTSAPSASSAATDTGKK